MTTIQQLEQIEKIIFSVPYDDLSDYLKGIRDMINLLNNEEQEETTLYQTIKEEIQRG